MNKSDINKLESLNKKAFEFVRDWIVFQKQNGIGFRKMSDLSGLNLRQISDIYNNKFQLKLENLIKAIKKINDNGYKNDLL